MIVWGTVLSALLVDMIDPTIQEEYCIFPHFLLNGIYAFLYSNCFLYHHSETKLK